MPRTLGSGTSHLPAFSLRFCLMVLLSTLARAVCGWRVRELASTPRSVQRPEQHAAGPHIFLSSVKVPH